MIIIFYLKIVWMCASAIASATFIYPFLHELGHCLGGLLAGANTVRIALSDPSVTMFLEQNDTLGCVISGLSGVLFPMLISLIKPRSLTGNSAILALRISNIMACFSCCFYAILSIFGRVQSTNDIGIIISFTGAGGGYFLAFFAVFTVILTWNLVRFRPVKRLSDCFI